MVRFLTLFYFFLLPHILHLHIRIILYLSEDTWKFILQKGSFHFSCPAVL